MGYTHPMSSWPIDLNGQNLSELDVDPIDLVERGMRSARYNASTEPLIYLGGHVENVRRELENRGYCEKVQFYGLHHDDAEAFLGEVIRPVRRQIEGYDEMENKVLEELWGCYGVESPSEEEWTAVRHADDKVLLWELDQVFEDEDVKEKAVRRVYSNNGWERPVSDLIEEIAVNSRLEYGPEEARATFRKSHENLLQSM